MRQYLLLFLMPVFITNISHAQEVTEPAAEAALVETAMPGTITFSFKDADIRNVLRLIAAKSGINIVYGPEVTGVVNMELKDVPWEQALSLVLDINGYAYQREGNVIKVISKEKLEAEPLGKKIFNLKYQSAVPRQEKRRVFLPDKGEYEEREFEVESIIPALKPLSSPRGDIVGDEMSNSILVIDLTRNINEIEEVLKELDKSPLQVLVEVKIIEISDKMEKDLGIKWKSLKEYKVSLVSPTRTYNSERSGGQTRTDEYVTTTKDSVQDDIIQGVTAGTLSETVTYDIDSSLDRTLTDTFTRALTKSDIRSAILSADSFELVLSALETKTDVRLVSNPRIVTINNSDALIFVGINYPIPKFKYNETTARYVISDFEYKDIGVKFIIKPLICKEDNTIKMFVTPEVSKIVDFTTFQDIVLPIIGKKIATTDVILNTSDTLAIGGLVDEDKSDVITKVPLLGDLPILGRLFRHKNYGKTENDIIFFITATIIDEETKRLIYEEEASQVVETPPDVYKKVFKSSGDRDLSKGNRGFVK